MENQSLASRTAANLADPAAAYLSQALTIMQTHALHRQTIDWATLLAETWRYASGASEPKDTYAAIEFALRQINDGHSHFWPPAKIQAIQTGREDSRNRPPTGQLLVPGIAYLHMPDFMGSSDAAMAYARTLQTIVAELDAMEPTGWIVDLTDNTGGSMFPMLVGLGPLFDTEEIGAFMDADGRRIAWRYVDNQCIVGPDVCLAIDLPVVQLHHRSMPVAVLTGPSTISSGEIVAIAFRGQALSRSFGQPTRGLPTANESFELSDGAEIILTVFISADRTGKQYDAAVMPDVVVEGGVEQVRALAIEWLKNYGKG